MPPEALHAEKGAEGENSAPRCPSPPAAGGGACSTLFAGSGARPPLLWRRWGGAGLIPCFWCVPGDAVVQRSVKRGAKQRGVSLHIVPITAAGLLVEQTLVYKIMLVREVDKLVS